MESESKIKNVAIIMDGNGRWANMRSHSRVWGHIRGSSVVSDIVEEAVDLKLNSLTLYAFSTENWSRPLLEVKTLFNLLKKFLLKEKRRIINNQIQFRVMGDISSLPDATKELIISLEEETKEFKGLKLTFAFGYGGRSEIVNAVNKAIINNPNVEITEQMISENLHVPEVKEIDLLIRTGGDQRVSNFLLWQIAYAELAFTNTKWPEFGRVEFSKIIKDVETRERRFGSVVSEKDLKTTSSMADENKKILNTSIGR